MSASTVVRGVDARTSGGAVATGVFITHSAPAGVQAGDVLIVGMQLREASTTYTGWRVPAGWTARTALSAAGSGAYAIYTATYGSDVTGTSWTWDNGAGNTTATRWSSCLVALAGSAVTGVAGHAARAVTSTAAPSSLSLTTNGPTVLVGFAGSRTSGGVTYTAPTGWVEQSDVSESTATNAATLEVSVDDTTPVAAGTYFYAPTTSPAVSGGFASVTALTYTAGGGTFVTAAGGMTASGTAAPIACVTAAGSGALSGNAIPTGTITASVTAAGAGSFAGLATASPAQVALPPIGIVGSPRWTWAFGDWGALPTGELVNGKQRSIKATLRGSSSATFTLDGWAPEAIGVRELVTDVWAIRNGRVLFRGRVGPSSDDIDGTKHTVSFTAGDYRGVLARRALYDSDTLTYTTADRGDVAWGLVVTTQGQAGGDLGIVRGATYTLGTTTTITYPAGQLIGPAIDQLQAMDAGFDWDVTPTLGTATQTFDLWSYRGINGSRVLSYPGSVASLRRQVDPGNYANAIRETGDTGLAAVRAEAPGVDITPEGRWDAQLGDTTLLDASSVSARAAYDLSMRSQVVPTYTVTLRPGEWGGPTDIWLGDTVTLAVRSGRLSVNGEQYRVQEVDIALDESDNETVTLTLGQLIAGQRFGDRSVLYRLTQLERR